MLHVPNFLKVSIPSKEVKRKIRRNDQDIPLGESPDSLLLSKVEIQIGLVCETSVTEGKFIVVAALPNKMDEGYFSVGERGGERRD